MIDDSLKNMLQALQDLYENGDGPSGTVHVKYRGDEAIYAEWAPRRHTDIEEDGLLDPGFGSGPVLFLDLDSIEVRRSDWVAQKGAVGERNFQGLQDSLVGQIGLDLSTDAIAWRRVR